MMTSWMRNSSSTSWAVAEPAWAGARRSTHPSAPRSTAKISQEPPPIMGVILTGARSPEGVIDELAHPGEEFLELRLRFEVPRHELPRVFTG